MKKDCSICKFFVYKPWRSEAGFGCYRCINPNGLYDVNNPSAPGWVNKCLVFEELIKK